MRNGSKRTRQAIFFCFPLFLSKLKSISCFGFSDLNLASLCSFLELIGELVRWSLLVAFSPPPSAMFLNCALLAFPTVRCLVWRRGKGRRGGSWGHGVPASDVLEKWLLLIYAFSFIFLFSCEEFSTSLLSQSLLEAAGYKLTCFSLLTTLLPWSLNFACVVTFSGVSEHSEGAQKPVPFLQKANQERHPLLGFGFHFISRGLSCQGVWVEGTQFHFTSVP